MDAVKGVNVRLTQNCSHLVFRLSVCENRHRHGDMQGNIVHLISNFGHFVYIFDIVYCVAHFFLCFFDFSMECESVKCEIVVL